MPQEVRNPRLLAAMGSRDVYTLIRNASGWEVRSPSESGPCDKAGRPWLFKALDHEAVNYPEELPGYLEWLWSRAEQDGMSHDEVLKALEDLAEWTSTCERNNPTGVFAQFK